MKKGIAVISIFIASSLLSCHDALDPKPIDQLVNDIVLNEPKDIEAVEIGLYQALRITMPTVVIAGDLTADNLVHNGTFTQYRELGVKKITSANGSASEMWGHIYQAIYIANFMIERIPEIPGVASGVRQRAMATAYFIRGLANFIGVVTFGGIPKVTTTNIEDNRNIPRASEEEMLAFILDDYKRALGQLDEQTATPAFASDYAVRAALARYYLYTKDYSAAEDYASQVINSGFYTLDADYSDIVLTDFPDESIFEVDYTIADDSDPNNLNTLFLGRREIIPSNEEIVLLDFQSVSGDRIASAKFDLSKLKGNDNGWSVAKYGTAVETNNNVYVFRLAEMHLIRAEARAYLGNVNGDNSAKDDINALRSRANATIIGDKSQSQMLQIIEDERRIELAFEGHRWYDLRRTNRIETVMPAFNSNWRSAFELWPIPQSELQNNPALVDSQNPGY